MPKHNSDIVKIHAYFFGVLPLPGPEGFGVLLG